MLNRIIGGLLGLLLLGGGLAATAPAQAGTPGVPDVSAEATVVFYTGTSPNALQKVTLKSDCILGPPQSFAKRLKVYVRDTNTGQYLQSDGTWGAAYYEFLSSSRTSMATPFVAPYSLKTGCAGGPPTYELTTLTFPTGSFINSTDVYKINVKAVDEDGDVQTAWNSYTL